MDDVHCTPAWSSSTTKRGVRLKRRLRRRRPDSTQLTLLLAAGIGLAACSESTPTPTPSPGLSDLFTRGSRVVEGATPRDGSLTLSQNEPTRLLLELTGAARLGLAGHTEAKNGRLTIDLEELSPDSGEVLQSRSIPLEAAGGRLEETLDLPPASSPLSVRLVWGAASAPLVLDRLVLLEPEHERVPIILFSLDTVSARHMSLYGYSRATTPNLEKLAAESVVFDTCFSNAAFTSPSYSSQFTGLLPRSSWIDPKEFARDQKRQPKKYETWHVPEERWTLAESLRAAGYRTAAFVDNPMASPAFGLGQGFELYDMSAQKIPIGNPEGGIRTAAPLALAWLDSLPSGEPFFLFVNVLDAHGPYSSPVEFHGRFDGNAPETGKDLPVCPEGHEIFGAIPDYNAYTLSKKKNPGRLPVGPMIQRYDEGLLFVDSELNGFIEALRARGILDRAALVITSDHGEMMDEGDFKFGHGVLSQDNLQIPLVLRLPEGRHGGLRVKRPVELVDLYPTFMELAGLRRRDYLHGRSLLSLCRGETVPERPICHEGGLLESIALTDGKWRLVEWHPGSGLMMTRYSFPPVKAQLEARRPELYADLWGSGDYARFMEALDRHRGELRNLDRRLVGGTLRQLFDLEADPDQRVDLAEKHPEIVERMVRLLEADAERTRLARERIRMRATELDAGLESELRGLGYVGDEEE